MLGKGSENEVLRMARNGGETLPDKEQGQNPQDRNKQETQPMDCSQNPRIEL